MSGTDKDDDAVGYGRPPKWGRFKKGRSGNPRGRPKGSRNFATDLDEILTQKMTIRENGQPKIVSSQKAALLRLRSKALKGETRALDRLLALAAERATQKDADATERSLSDAEEDILERYAEHVLGRQLEEGEAADEPS